MLCRCERRQSVFQMGSSFMCFKPPSWCLIVCLRGLLFWNCNGTGGIGSSFLSEIQTWVHFRDYSSPEALTCPKWLTTMLKNTSWLHSFISLCLRLISCKFSFFFHFAMSFSKISLCPPSLFFLIVFLALSNSIMAWAVSLYARHCMLFPLGWEIDYKSQVFLWSNPVLLQTKSHFLKYSKIEQESVALLMIPDLLAVRALLKKLLPLAFFQGHCVFTPFLVPWFLGLLPACFLILSPVSFTLINSLTLHSMFTSGSTLHCVTYY